MSATLAGVRLWDGEAPAASGPGWLRIEGGEVASFDRAPPAAGPGQRLALDGCTAIPGLIDAHVHLGLDPALATPEEQAAVPLETRRRAMAQRAAGMLRVGITTARDLGGGDHSELALRDAIAAGRAVGPRLLCAGQPVTSPGGHCHFWGGEAGDDEAIAAVVSRQVEAGADWIKVMATGGLYTRGTRPGEAQFELASLRHLVDCAGRAGRRVAAHCHGTEGIRRASRAGVHTIEHCSFASRAGFGSDFDVDLVEELAAGEAAVSPTVNEGWGRRSVERGRGGKDGRAGEARRGAEGGRGEEDVGESEFFRRMSRVLRALAGAGVPLIASTDAGIHRVPHDGLPRALPVFARYAGLLPRDTLVSATSRSADRLGLGRRAGRLLPGYGADVLVVRGDPLEDLTALTRPVLVASRGRVAWSAPDVV